MPLTPADVHNVVFSRPRLGRRGYSPEEVDTLLELVEDELSRHIEEESELRKLNATYLHREGALQRKAAELREFDARLRQWEADLRDEELELHQREAQLRQRETEVNQKASELHRYEVARQQKVVALRQHEAKLRQLETALHQEAAELRQQGGAVVHHQDATIRQQEAAITRQESQVRTNGASVHQQIDHQQRTAVGEDRHIETFRTVAEIRGRHAMEWTAVRAVADLLGGSTTETKQELLRTTETEHSTNGVAAIESAQMKQLQQENAELSRVNGILKAAAALFAAEIKSPGLSVEDLIPHQDYP